jgi:hypothetical protein
MIMQAPEEVVINNRAGVVAPFSIEMPHVSDVVRTRE